MKTCVESGIIIRYDRESRKDERGNPFAAFQVTMR